MKTAMKQERVKALCSIPGEWLTRLVWGSLGVFLAVHVAVLVIYLYGPIENEQFVFYSNVTEVATHVFALPALLDANVAGVREVVSLATVVSTVYHILENFTHLEETSAWHTMDRATATGLIATVFLNFLSHIHHNYAAIIFLVGIASSAKEGGNILAAGIVATIFLLSLLQQKKKTQGENLLQYVVKTTITVLSLGGSAPEADALDLDTWMLLRAIGLNVAAIAAFVFAANNKEYDQWAHSLWHAIVYTVLWQLVRVLVDARRKKEGESRKDREVYGTLLPPKKGTKWRLGTGRWS